jgi:hypothetical protein
MNRIIFPDTMFCRLKVLFLEIQQQINKRRKLTYVQVKFHLFIFAKMQLTWFLYNSERVNYGRKHNVLVWTHDKSVAKVMLAIPFHVSSFQYGCHFVNWSSTEAPLVAAMFSF